MVAPKKINYEETRLMRLEENKKRMAELKLTVLAQSLRTPSTPKPSSMKKVNRGARKPVDLSAVRRSSRVADKPPQVYKEEPIEPLGSRRSYGGNRARDLSGRVYASDEDREYALGRADELHSTLEPARRTFNYRDEVIDTERKIGDEDVMNGKHKYLPRKQTSAIGKGLLESS
ncbi:hypothetical protein Tco_0618817 [Tanacetum coccineum]